MNLRLEGQREHKGFILSESITLEGATTVLTGLNGSGKTRLTESIFNKQTVIYYEGQVLSVLAQT